MPKFKPPEGEKDRRILARELYVKGKTEQEITDLTGLDAQVVKNIVKWLETTAYGQKWIEERKATLGLKPGPQQSQGQAESQEAEAGSQAQTQAPVAPVEAPSQERLEPGRPLPGLPPLAGQPPSPYREGWSPSRSPSIKQTLVVDRADAGSAGAGAGGQQGAFVFETHQDSAQMPSDPVTGKLAQTFLTPMTINWFTYLRGRGYDKPLHLFLEECVVGFFKQKGLRMAVVQEYVD